MAALTATQPSAAGTLWSPAAVSASDTITSAQLGNNGAYLVVINGNASSDTVTITDAGRTPAGNAAATYTVSVVNATTKAIYLSPRLVDPSTGLVTVTHSVTTTVTYTLLPIG